MGEQGITNSSQPRANKSRDQRQETIQDFDVFLCHNKVDKLVVKEIGEQLKERGISPWLDEWELRPGLPWQPELAKQIRNIKSAVVFIGKSGRGPWQDMEIQGFLRQFVRRECPVIPVILADGEYDPDVPLFLENMTWVDFRNQDPDPMEHLIFGITGRRSLKKTPTSPNIGSSLLVRRQFMLAGELILTVVLPVFFCIAVGYFIESAIHFGGFFSQLGILIGLIVGMAGAKRFISHLHLDR